MWKINLCNRKIKEKSECMSCAGHQFEQLSLDYSCLLHDTTAKTPEFWQKLKYRSILEIKSVLNLPFVSMKRK